jgi:methylmalonyl-CoA/ethylmalonyl-CoA epimerase
MKINHLGIAVKNIEASCDHYSESLGWKKITNKIFDPIQGVNVLFMVDQHNIKYELIEPRSPDSPVNKLLEKRSSLYHFCYEVEDINLKIQQLSRHGFLLISGPVEAIAFNGNLIAFLINRDNLIIELLER